MRRGPFTNLCRNGVLFSELGRILWMFSFLKLRIKPGADRTTSDNNGIKIPQWSVLRGRLGFNADNLFSTTKATDGVRLRRLVGPPFAKKFLRDQEQIFKDCTKRAMVATFESIIYKSQGKRAIDFQHHIVVALSILGNFHNQRLNKFQGSMVFISLLQKCLSKFKQILITSTSRRVQAPFAICLTQMSKLFPVKSVLFTWMVLHPVRALIVSMLTQKRETVTNTSLRSRSVCRALVLRVVLISS